MTIRRHARGLIFAVGIGIAVVPSPLAPLASPARSVLSASAQAPIEGAVRDLRSPDADTRRRAVQVLKPLAAPEAAIPLAPALTDPIDAIQHEAIAAVLNIFLADRVVPSRRVALIIEVRRPIEAEPTFSSGPLSLNGLPVPAEVLGALMRASRDNNPRVAVEALYAFGALGAEPSGPVRHEMLRLHGPALAGMLGVPDPFTRVAAARVIGRLFEPQAGDGATDQQVGDAVIVALNDRLGEVQIAATDALGAMRYERAVQALTERYQYDGDPRRNRFGHAAFLALSRIAHASSLPLFQEQLAAGNASTRILAIEGLARLGDPSFLDTIRNSITRDRSTSVLLAERFASVRLSSGSLDPLFEALTKSSLRDQAFRYLIELAPGQVATRLGSRAQDPSARIRADVADLIGLSREVSALPLLEPLRQDKDPDVARAAGRAWARLRSIQ